MANEAQYINSLFGGAEDAHDMPARILVIEGTRADCK